MAERSAPAGSAAATADASSPSAIASRRCPTCAARYPADFRVCPRDATPLEDAPGGEDGLLGSVLGESYTVLRVIGEGGMGRVYEASHRRLPNKRFAIKVLHHEFLRQPEVMTRFQREAEAASALCHPNVVDVVDVNCTPDGRPYIVQELLEGQDLGSHLERVGRLPITASIAIVRQVCRALGEAHARGIIHRDVKPDNVFLVGDPGAPSVKVLDFGISKVGDDHANLTKTGVVMGTPAYMPPEQARGAHVDYRADIYSVGAILYRMLTGRKPFEERDTVATLTAVVAEEPKRPSSLERTIPPELELVIQRAMAKDPAERYGSLADLDAALVAVEGALPANGQGASLASAASAEAADGNARTVLDPLAGASSRSQPGEGPSPSGARSSLVWSSLLVFAWLLLGLVDVLVSIVRALRGAGPLTSGELSATVLCALALLATPAAFWVRHLVKRIWPSTLRAVEGANRLRRAVGVSFATYSFGLVAAHLFETLSRSQPQGLSWFGWFPLAYASGVLGLIAGYSIKNK